MKHCDAEEIARILKVKLNMCNIGANFGKPESCRVCKQELETTEHLFECEAVGRMIGKYKGNSITRCRAHHMQGTKTVYYLLYIIEEYTYCLLYIIEEYTFH